MRTITTGESSHQQLYRWACLLWANGMCDGELNDVLYMMAVHSTWSEEERRVKIRAIHFDAVRNTPRRDDPDDEIGPPPAEGEECWNRADVDEFVEKHARERADV